MCEIARNVKRLQLQTSESNVGIRMKASCKTLMSQLQLEQSCMLQIMTLFQPSPLITFDRADNRNRRAEALPT
jgi:hypothetical protein